MNPKTGLGPARFAYVVVDSTRKHDPTIDVTHAPAAPRIGDIVVFPDDQGRAEIIREDDHEVLVDIVHLHFVAIGRENEDGNVEFSYEAKRMLALLQIGAQQERTLHAEIDRVFDQLGSVFALAGLPDEQIDRLRKEFI